MSRLSGQNHSIAPLLVLAALVAIAVVGRWGQPDWAVTPLSAVALMAGYAAPRLWQAALTPVVALAVSNLVLPPYQTLAVGLTVAGSLAVSATLGRLLRRPATSLGAGAARLLALSLAPALLFFVTTNFAVWASQAMYPKTVAGLAECYAAGLPFLRRMLVGDACYVALLFGAAAAAGAFSLRGLPSTGQASASTNA